MTEPGRKPLIFGGGPIGGLFEPVSDDDAAATLGAAWRAGVRAFDTAPHYGAGLSERRLGEFLAGRPRADFAVSTKVGRRLVPASSPAEGVEGFYGDQSLSRVRDYSRDGVRASLEDSLRRLRLDRVDIALIHDPDDFLVQALDSAYPALAELRAEGLIGAIGVGMNSAAPLAWFASRADLDCVLVAGRYSLLDASASDVLFPLCVERGVKVLAGGVFNSGILADPRDGAYYDYAPAPDPLLARARRIRDICAAYGVPVAAAALQFTLRHPAVTAAVVGARSAAEITCDAAYLSLSLPDELFSALAGVLRGSRTAAGRRKREATVRSGESLAIIHRNGPSRLSRRPLIRSGAVLRRPARSPGSRRSDRGDGVLVAGAAPVDDVVTAAAGALQAPPLVAAAVPGRLPGGCAIGGVAPAVGHEPVGVVDDAVVAAAEGNELHCRLGLPS